jgi:hypothetical protein
MNSPETPVMHNYGGQLSVTAASRYRPTAVPLFADDFRNHTQILFKA